MRAVRTPFRAAASATARDRRQRLLRGPRLRLDDEELTRRLAIGIGIAVAHERDARSVRRPRRPRFIDLAIREAIEFLRRDVEQINKRVAVRQQIALAILLVLVAIDDDRLRDAVSTAPVAARPRCGVSGRRGAAVGRRVGRLRIGIADDEDETLRVGRPLVALQTALHLGQLKRFAAASIEQPHLIAARLAGPGRGEREIAAVGTVLRRGLAVLARRDLPLVLSVDVHGPDVRAALVFLHVRRRNDEGDGLPVRRALRIADVFHLREIVERQRSLGGLCGQERDGRERKRDRQQRTRQGFTHEQPPAITTS